jgi:hypothetical protein
MGARALSQILHEIINPIEVRLPDLWNEGIRKIVICPEVLNGANPQLLKDSSQSFVPLHIMNFEKTEDNISLLKTKEGKRKNIYTKDIPFLHRSTKKSCLSDTSNWNNEKLLTHLNQIRSTVGYNQLEGSALKFWEAFERDNSQRLRLVIRVVEELAIHSLTIDDFFTSLVYSETYNLLANIKFGYYKKLRKQKIIRKTRSKKETRFTVFTMATRRRFRFEEASLSAQIFWNIVEEEWIPSLVCGTLEIFANWEERELSVEQLFSYAAKGRCYSLRMLDYWISYTDLRIADAEYSKMEEKNEDLSSSICLINGYLVTQEEKCRSILFNRLIKNRYITWLLDKFPSVNPAINKDCFLFSEDTDHSFVYKPLSEELELVESLISKNCICIDKYLLECVLEYLAPCFKHTFIEEPSPPETLANSLLKVHQGLISECDVHIKHLQYLPSPHDILPEKMNEFLIYISTLCKKSDKVASECLRLWGPGPWTQGSPLLENCINA